MKNIPQQMNVCIRHRMHGGRAETAPCVIRVLTPEDAGEAVRMYDSVVHGLSQDIFARTTPDQIERAIAGDGIAVGVWYGDRLACLRTLRTGGEWVEHTFDDWGLDHTEHGKSAMMGFCVVDKEFRGNNIQFLSYYYMEHMAAAEFDSIITTVSPQNIFSLQNIFNYGFIVIGLANIYEGHLRYIMKKTFRPPMSVWTRHHLRVPLSNTLAQKRALDAGLVAYKLIRSGRGFCLLFGRTDLD